MAAKDTRPKPTKVRKESSEATSKRTEKSAATVQDSDDSEDIDQVNPNRPQESVDSSDDSDSDSSDDSEGDAVGPVKTAQKKGEKYAPYAPPQGMTPFALSTVKTTIASSPFEWNALAAKPGVELWAIRVPRNFKPARLADFTPAADAESSSRGIMGTVQTSKTTYQLRVATTETSSATQASVLPSNTEQDPASMPTLADSLLLPNSLTTDMDVDGIGKGIRQPGDSNTSHEAAVKEELGVGKVVAVGGEEMEGLRLVVPDVRRNALFTAPKKITKHLILAPLAPQAQSTDHAEPTLPSSIPSTNADGTALTKRAQPLEKLKYRNLPFGATDKTTKPIVDRVDPQREHSVAQVKRKADAMDVDEEPMGVDAVVLAKEKKEKKKSRKSEVAGQDKEKKSERKEKKSRKSVA
ncbi:hypothetical protein NCC49_000044 [Naganishia albida]|nr:hypothetical protein NCC49_000044 [Naganishia albida]